MREFWVGSISLPEKGGIASAFTDNAAMQSDAGTGHGSGGLLIRPCIIRASALSPVAATTVRTPSLMLGAEVLYLFRSRP